MENKFATTRLCYRRTTIFATYRARRILLRHRGTGTKFLIATRRDFTDWIGSGATRFITAGNEQKSRKQQRNKIFHRKPPRTSIFFAKCNNDFDKCASRASRQSLLWHDRGEHLVQERSDCTISVTIKQSLAGIKGDPGLRREDREGIK